MAADEHGGTCPYCDSEKKHLNNHIRMSTGQHGSQGQYPEDWDRDTRQRSEAGGSGPSEIDPETAGSVEQGGEAVEPPAEPRGSEGQTVHGLGDDHGEGEPSSGAAPIEFGDDPADAREYECGQCGTEIGYLDSECSDCGQANAWQGVAA